MVRFSLSAVCPRVPDYGKTRPGGQIVSGVINRARTVRYVVRYRDGLFSNA